ncbi:MAG: hypothetical protein ACFFC6_00505 [Promethearchaeota archaeon]
MARPGRESFKRFIKTILEQIPPYIKGYLPSDQTLLTEFFSILENYEEADFQRDRLSQRIEKYIEGISETPELIEKAFLWFTYFYIQNADTLLNISGFHADSFYEYLVKHLRGSGDTPGVFNLIRQQVPLTNLAWEKLQYESNKLIYPLSEQQLQIIHALYSFIKKGGIDALNPRRIKKAITNQVPFQSNEKPATILSRFFKFINGSWYLRFHSPAFGLDRLAFHFEVNKGRSLSDIIDFLDSSSTVLGYSAIYYDRNNPKTHFGTLVIPIETINQLTEYLHQRDAEGAINLIDLTKINSIHRKVSFEKYEIGTGWAQLKKTEQQRLTDHIKAKNPRKMRKPAALSFTTPDYNIDWNFRDHPLPSEIIQLYCRVPGEFSYSSLPIQPVDRQNAFTLSQAEIGLLKQLLYNHVVHIGFVPYRLVYEFALDAYWIKIPQIPQIQLKKFLNILPYCEYYLTDSSILVWTRLTPQLRQWIEKDLLWEIYQLLPTHPPQELKEEWFDDNNLMWIPPEFLQ